MLRICVPKRDGILTNDEVNNHKWMEVYVKIMSHAHSDSPTVQLLSMKGMMSLLSEGNSDASCLLSAAWTRQSRLPEGTQLVVGED